MIVEPTCASPPYTSGPPGHLGKLSGNPCTDSSGLRRFQPIPIPQRHARSGAQADTAAVSNPRGGTSGAGATALSRLRLGPMLRQRVHLVLTLGIAALGAMAVSPVSAQDPVQPKNGQYNAKCPEGAFDQCGESYWTVSNKGRTIKPDAKAPWPNDLDDPSIGICGRYNPITTEKIAIKDGEFTHHGKWKGRDFTWKGEWVKPGKVKGFVKWDGCPGKHDYVGRPQ